VRQLAHRFVLTENCNATCKHCFNAGERDGAVMDADMFLEFVRKNSDLLGDTRALLMGGEPTMHPRIIEMMLEAAKYYRVADLFTNGTRLHKIAKHPEVIREHFKDKIIYTINGYVFDEAKYLEYKDYTKKISLHFVITTWGHEEIAKKILRCIELGPEAVSIVLSVDTMVDIFDEEMMKDYRKIWLDTLKKIIPSLNGSPISWSTDHRVPYCFFTQEMIDELNLLGLEHFHFEVSACTCASSGLIDTAWDLWYCNQTRIKLGSLIKENNELMRLPEIVNKYITPGHKIKTNCIKNLREKCKNCNALDTCRVGCYYNTLVRHCSN